MRMLHATAFKNVARIYDRGILASRSKAARKTIWLVSPSMYAAAVSHAQKRHGLAPEEVAVIVVDVPRSWLRKAGRKGVKHTGGRNIPPERIKAFYFTTRLARKPGTGAKR